MIWRKRKNFWGGEKYTGPRSGAHGAASQSRAGGNFYSVESIFSACWRMKA